MASSSPSCPTGADPASKCSLEPINLHDPSQAAELLRQRHLCGWKKTPEFVTALRDAMDAGTKTVFWINKPAPAPAPAASSPSASAPHLGHVSLDSTASPPDLSLANPHDKSVLSISNLFVLPAHRRDGVARAALALLARCAKEAPYGSPNCRAVACTTLTRRYHEEDAWRARFEVLNGTPAPERGRANEDWYVRMGFVKFKEEPRYPAEMPGMEGEFFVASFLRREI